MDFRLIYEGRLPAERDRGRAKEEPVGRAKEKHGLRKHFHKQLRSLWRQHPDLRSQASSLCYLSDQGQAGKRFVFVDDRFAAATNVKPYIQHIADAHQLCGGRFVPLVSKAGGFTCSLEILFLRRDNPGGLIASGGDIDNRIKVLFDGLRMPNTTTELGGLPLEADEDPFYCLLEDDNLITAVSVTTDRLLTPQTSDETVHDVHLIIHATVVNPSALFAGNRLV